MQSNVQLTKVCLRDTRLRPYFTTVCSKDNLPPATKRCGFTILNLESSKKDRTRHSGEGGSHWTGLMWNGGSALYADSMGEPPPLYVVLWAGQYNKALTWSRHQIQDYGGSQYCGWFALWCALNDFFRLLPKDDEDSTSWVGRYNDRIVEAILADNGWC